MSQKSQKLVMAGGTQRRAQAPPPSSFEPDVVAAAKASPTFRAYVDTYLRGGGDPKLLEGFSKNPTWAEKQQFLTGYLAGGGSLRSLLGLRSKPAQIEKEIEAHIDQQRETWEEPTAVALLSLSS
jgi:hypothetical protein